MPCPRQLYILKLFSHFQTRLPFFLNFQQNVTNPPPPTELFDNVVEFLFEFLILTLFDNIIQSLKYQRSTPKGVTVIQF